MCSAKRAEEVDTVKLQWFRLRLALLAAISTLAFAGTFQPQPRESTGLPPSVFWARKISWQQCFDLVFAGDSRTYRGVLPAVALESRSDLRAGNYGFSGVGIDGEYLRAIDRLLDLKSAKEMLVVLGVTPYSLTEAACLESGFLEWSHEAPVELWMLTQLGGLRDYSPLSMVLSRLSGRRYYRYYQEFRADGSVPSSQVPESRWALREYREALGRTRVRRQCWVELEQAIRSWRTRGVRVIGYRPPSCAEMANLEDEITGYPGLALPHLFRSLGGEWIEFNSGDYPTYDGSHLRKDGARQFSRDLMRQLWPQ